MKNRPAKAAEKADARILHAALEAFGEHGFDGAKTRDIAARAGVKQPLIAYHFTTKEDLWRAAAASIFGDFNAMLDMLIHGAKYLDPESRMRQAVRTFVTFVGRNPSLLRLIIQEGARETERSRWLVETWLEPSMDKLFEAVGVGDFSRARNAGFRMSMLSLLSGANFAFAHPILYRMIGKIDASAASFIDGHADFVADTLVGMLRLDQRGGQARSARPRDGTAAARKAR